VSPLHDQQGGIKRARIKVVGKLCHRAAVHRVLLPLARTNSIIGTQLNVISLSSIEMMSGSASD
jgi:hypothetical protein